MSIEIFPFGIPISNSLALSASFALNTNPANFPTTAAFAEYVINYTAPTGPSGSTASGSNVRISVNGVIV